MQTLVVGPVAFCSEALGAIHVLPDISNSLPTLSSTPLMNCTDSGLENLRAISSASLIMTARGVAGNPSNSATAARRILRSTPPCDPYANARRDLQSVCRLLQC